MGDHGEQLCLSGVQAAGVDGAGQRTVTGDEEPRAANRRRLLLPSMWVVVAVAYAVVILTVGGGRNWPAHLVQLAGPVVLVLAMRDLSTGRAREAVTGGEPWAAWLVTLCILVPSSLIGLILLLATW